MVHGVFDHHVTPLVGGFDLSGFYTGRSVIARDQREAIERLFDQIMEGLADGSADIRGGFV
jgi:hypothetical protein